MSTFALFKNKLLSVVPILIAVGIAAKVASWGETFSTGTLERHHQVVDAANAILNDLLDAETSVRGFAITGDEEFLGPYKAALERIDPDTGALRVLVADDPQQRERMKEIEPLITKKFSLLREGIELRRNSGLEAIVELSKLKRGKTTMDAIRALIADMKAEENRRASESLNLTWW